MEKKVLLVVFVTFLILTTFPFVYSQSNSTEEQQKVNKAFQCLEDKTEGKCSALSTEEKIFTLLAIDECQAEVMADSQNEGECWPSGNCNVKTTAQAILALENTNVDTEKAQDWLIAQNKTTTELSWFLEIENSEPTTCSVGYAGLSFNVNIGEDKKLSNNAGSCLSLAQDNNWFRVSPSCFDEEFSVSCDKSFLTTLLFQKINSPTIHVLQKSSSSSASGTTTEKVDSTCFSQGGGCSYEGTLWASLVLDSLEKNMDSHLPYMITLAEENRRFLPESFLYFMTSDIEQRTSLLGKQKSSKWWEESGDKFYDTPLALYPFQQESVEEKINSKEWLLSVQDENGCWENNIRNTAFTLASIWPRDFSSSGTGGEGFPSCEGAGNFCTSIGDCGGEILSDLDCPALSRCCSTAPIQETCSDQGGTVCSSSQVCSGGNEVSTQGLGIGESCCIGGFCEAKTVTPPTTKTECELSGGSCRSFGCNANEESSSLSCDFGGDVCCVLKSSDEGGSFLIWFFVVLIILVILGIIFREKLRMLLFRIKSKFGKGRGSSTRKGPGPGYRPGPGGRPPLYSRPRTAIPERRILLPSEPSRRPMGRPVSRGKSKAQKELDDVLKKLKGMGK